MRKNTIKKSFLLGTLLLFPLLLFATDKKTEKIIENSIQRSVYQSKMLASSLLYNTQLLPKSLDEKGALTTSLSTWWTSGFFAGTLWYLYDATKDEELKEMAEEYTKRVECEQYTTNNHDVGFMIYCSVGNAQRLFPSKHNEEVLLTAARSLSTRFRPLNGCIQSWNMEEWNRNCGWQCPVIIDNMMNLELLMWAYKHTGDESLRQISLSHADTTLKNHFREDKSCYHVISYDTISGSAHHKGTHQGYSHESAWARGQGWALYGYTMMYRETGREEYLNQAIAIAAFLLNHPNLPADKIPYWDFNAPDIPQAKRDASAAAVMASALIELSLLVKDNKLAKKYLSVARKQLINLSSPPYMVDEGTNSGYILKHSVGNMPGRSEVDVPLSYADYYYVEALLRYRKIIAK